MVFLSRIVILFLLYIALCIYAIYICVCICIYTHKHILSRYWTHHMFCTADFKTRFLDWIKSCNAQTKSVMEKSCSVVKPVGQWRPHGIKPQNKGGDIHKERMTCRRIFYSLLYTSQLYLLLWKLTCQTLYVIIVRKNCTDFVKFEKT